MNPYYYLFYKLNSFLNKKKDNEWGVILGISIVIGQNIAFIYVNFINDYERHRVYLISFHLALFVFNSILFLNKSRVNRIIECYGKESKSSKTIGSTVVIIYIIISMIAVFF